MYPSKRNKHKNCLSKVRIRIWIRTKMSWIWKTGRYGHTEYATIYFQTSKTNCSLHQKPRINTGILYSSENWRYLGRKSTSNSLIYYIYYGSLTERGEIRSLLLKKNYFVPVILFL
jgi:hypothetical protein